MSHIEDDEPPIKTGVTSNAYRDNWDRIFGEKAPKHSCRKRPGTDDVVHADGCSCEAKP